MYEVFDGVQTYVIRDQMMESINRYIDHGIIPGSFLQAVICNDLKGAIFGADLDNGKNIRAFVEYFHMECPSDAWGSKEKMRAWSESVSPGDTKPPGDNS